MACRATTPNLRACHRLVQMKSVNTIPVILSGPQSLAIAPSSHETALLDQARKLYDLGFHDHALLNL